ncbi:MAG: tetratricopeptide repeat protein [Pseudonocardiaceae bacterium]
MPLSSQTDDTAGNDDNDQPAEAIRLLEDGVERAGHDPFVQLRLRHFLAAALFYAGEYTRAAPLFDVVGRDYRRYLAPSNAFVLDSAYYAGHAYAEIGESDKALPQLRFYVHHADAAGDEEAARMKVVAAERYVEFDERRKAVEADEPGGPSDLDGDRESTCRSRAGRGWSPALMGRV